MANGNGHTNGSGQGKGHCLSARRAAGLESLGFVVAEGAGMVTGLGVVAIADQVAPGLVDAGCKVVSRTLVKPFLDPIEKILGKVCKLEECKTDESLPREKRADQLAHTIVVFGASWAGALAAKLGARRFMNKTFGIQEAPRTGNWVQRHLVPTKKELAILGADDGVHHVLMAWMNTSKAGAEYTDEMIKSTTKMLSKVFGMPEEKAHQLSAYAMIWEAPNLAGLAAGLGMIGLSHKYPQTLGGGHGAGHNH